MHLIKYCYFVKDRPFILFINIDLDLTSLFSFDDILVHIGLSLNIAELSVPVNSFFHA